MKRDGLRHLLLLQPLHECTHAVFSRAEADACLQQTVGMEGRDTTKGRMIIFFLPQVALKGVCAQQPPWLMVLEFCNDGDLLSHLQNLNHCQRRMRLSEQLRAARDIAQGLEYLASKVMAGFSCRQLFRGRSGAITPVSHGGRGERFMSLPKRIFCFVLFMLDL